MQIILFFWCEVLVQWLCASHGRGSGYRPHNVQITQGVETADTGASEQLRALKLEDRYQPPRSAATDALLLPPLCCTLMIALLLADATDFREVRSTKPLRTRRFENTAQPRRRPLHVVHLCSTHPISTCAAYSRQSEAPSLGVLAFAAVVLDWGQRRGQLGSVSIRRLEVRAILEVQKGKIQEKKGTVQAEPGGDGSGYLSGCAMGLRLGLGDARIEREAEAWSYARGRDLKERQWLYSHARSVRHLNFSMFSASSSGSSCSNGGKLIIKCQQPPMSFFHHLVPSTFAT